MAELTTVGLIEKIARAKMHIEKLVNMDHRKGCILASDDPDANGPCTCGVTEVKNIAFAAQQELKLE